MSRTSLCLLVLVSTSVVAQPLHAENWPQWRGPEGNGVSRETDLPTVWSKELGIEWKCELPEWGNSTPAIWGDAIFVTTQLKDGQLVVLRIDKKNGRIQWAREVGTGTFTDPGNAKSPDKRREAEFHRENNMATPSPVTDGRVVVVHFGNGDLAAYDFDGKQLWHRNLQKDHGNYTIWWGHSSSPVLCGDLVISVCMQDACRNLPGDLSPSYLVAHEVLTGKQRWKTMRMVPLDGERCDSYGSPILRRVGDRQEIVVMGCRLLDAHDPASGKRLWHLPDLTGHRLIPSPIAAGGMIFATTGFYEDEGLLAVKVAGIGKRPRDEIVWKYEKGISDSPSPVVWGEQVYFVNNGGIARCLDAQSGRLLWTKRISGQYRASPMAADGKIYFLNTQGLTTVVKASPEFERLGENRLDDDQTFASPAVSDGKIFIRGRKWLHCLK